MAWFFIFLSVFLMSRAFTCVKINLSILSFLFGNFLSYKRNFPYNKIKKIFFNVFSRRHEHLDFMFMTMIHSKYFVCYKVGVKIIFPLMNIQWFKQNLLKNFLSKWNVLEHSTKISLLYSWKCS